jgi:outer membrane protein assembly factor BamB
MIRISTAISLVFFLICFSACLSHQKAVESYNPVSPWSTFQYDMQRSGISPYNGPEKPALIWRFETGGGIYTPPTIDAEGTIYTGSDDFNLYAINPDGCEKWHFGADNWVRTSPVVSLDGTIYVGSRDDNLYAITPDGTIKWKFMTKS